MSGVVDGLRRDLARLSAMDPVDAGDLLADLERRIRALEASASVPSATLTISAPQPQAPLAMREAQARARRAAADQWRAVHPLSRILRVAVTRCRARTWGQRSGATLYHVEGYVRTVTGRATWDADVSPQDGTVVGITIR